jgi:hypothetical protein
MFYDDGRAKLVGEMIECTNFILICLEFQETTHILIVEAKWQLQKSNGEK